MRASLAERLAWLPLALLTACGGPEPPTSVLLISVDTLRRDHVSAYGYERPTTPELDGLADRGVIFSNAWSSSNWTLPAHMTLMTGLGPSRHGVDRDTTRVPNDIHMLAETFREAGRSTAGFASHIYLEPLYGFDRGFDTYDVVPDRRAMETTRKAIDWLDSQGGEPFFLFLHYFDPHWDFDPPTDFRARFGATRTDWGTLAYLQRYFVPGTPMPAEVRRQVVALYDAEIAYTDAAIGLLLEHLEASGLADDTVVAIVADHGEEFGDHSGFGHGTHLHAEVTRIPMIIRAPGGEAGATRMDPVSLADIPGTLLRLVGIASPEQFSEEGIDLFRDADAAAPRALVAESSRQGPKRLAVLRGGYRWLGPGSYRPIRFVAKAGAITPVELSPVQLERSLFAIEEDPAELHNVVEAHPDVAARLVAVRDALVEETARGVRLLCDAADGTPIEGTLRFRETLVDEPFPLVGDASVTRRGDAGDAYQVVLRPGVGAAGLVLPSPDPGFEARLSAAGRSFGGRVEAPADGDPSRLGADGAPGSACRISMPRSAESPGTRVRLDAADVEALRALGYGE